MLHACREREREQKYLTEPDNVKHKRKGNIPFLQSMLSHFLQMGYALKRVLLDQNPAYHEITQALSHISGNFKRKD